MSPVPQHLPSPDPNDEDELYEYSALSTLNWSSTGLGLWWSATWLRRGYVQTHLLPHHPGGDWLPNSLFLNEELMLRGMAIECMGKALFIHDRLDSQQSSIAELKKLKWFGRHDLEKIIDEARFDVSPRERELLQLLGVFVRWRGRYPTPMPNEKSEYVPLKAFAWEDNYVLNQFWERLSKLVSERMA